MEFYESIYMMTKKLLSENDPSVGKLQNLINKEMRYKDFLRAYADESDGFENILFEFSVSTLWEKREEIEILSKLSSVVFFLRGIYDACCRNYGSEDEAYTIPAKSAFENSLDIKNFLESEWGFKDGE